MGLTKRKIELLREFVGFCCEVPSCSKKEDGWKLEPHRVKQGGEYCLRNILMVCPFCHKIFSSAQNKSEGIYG